MNKEIQGVINSKVKAYFPNSVESEDLNIIRIVNNGTIARISYDEKENSIILKEYKNLYSKEENNTYEIKEMLALILIDLTCTWKFDRVDVQEFEVENKTKKTTLEEVK